MDDKSEQSDLFASISKLFSRSREILFGNGTVIMSLSIFDNQHVSKVSYLLVTGNYLAFVIFLGYLKGAVFRVLTLHKGVLPSSPSPLISAYVLHFEAYPT